MSDDRLFELLLPYMMAPEIEILYRRGLISQEVRDDFLRYLKAIRDEEKAILLGLPEETFH